MKLTLATLAVVLGSALAVHQMQMDRMETKREKLIREGKYTAWYQQEQMRRLAQKFARGAFGGTESQPLNNVGDASYSGNITLGTPGQPFRVIMDTGSANTWVTSSKCGNSRSCPFYCRINPQLCAVLCSSNCCNLFETDPNAVLAGDPCAGKSEYTCSKSSTCQESSTTFSIQYGTGSCSGTLTTDKGCLTGSTPNLCVQQHTFGEATHLADFFAGQPMDGIMGLGFRSIAVDNVEPFVDQLIDQHALSQNIFTVWMSMTQGRGGGTITFGGYDTTHCAASSTVQWVNLVAETYWEFRIDGFSCGSASGSGGNVISDTGTSLLAGPSSAVANIANAVGASYNSAYGLYFMPCSGSGTPDIVFSINGNPYHITAKNYVVPAGNGQCILGAQGGFSGGGLTWILGDTFIRQFCQVYDKGNNRLGLIKATM